MVYSGRESGKRRMGVGFIIEKTRENRVPGYNRINERIIAMRMKGHPMNITFDQVRHPLQTLLKKVIEEFYETLQGTLDNIPKKDVTILMDDWNAKIGNSRKHFERNIKEKVRGDG